ncbi:MAG: 2-amino-4-hydroxy-6-hydroxymethyldihydropteridine diphosphokinase [Caulobacter sp.]|nr:2-amino-4-hydroxy-6-hydroxymethyldihydropteridine diphosphokinase [Caulobacter sp.]MDP1960951.1 2-amino-4-hydroxy-6-hydroxymethyldihydropteridine diphosphokinase [Reyranella sp.]
MVIALGSSLAGAHASREALLEDALSRFDGLGLRVIARSAWWRSAAWPDPSGPDYRNGVVLVETGLTPAETLATLHGIERDFGRLRGEVNAPRTLDLDLIAFGRRTLEGPGLQLPHPRAHTRLFVMGPLAQIAPDWRHPVSCETARALAQAAIVGADARQI